MPSNFPFAYSDELKEELAAYLDPDPAGPLLDKYMRRDRRLRGRARSTSWSSSTPTCSAACVTSSAWSRACRSPTRRWRCAPAPAATRRGCWCRSCGGSASPPASSPAISSSSGPTSIRSKGRRAPTRISPICTPGPRSICRAPAGSAWTRPPACSAARAICRCARRRIIAPRRRSPARSIRRR